MASSHTFKTPESQFDYEMKNFIDGFSEETSDVKEFDTLLAIFKGKIADPLNRLMNDAYTPLMYAFKLNKTKLAKHILTRSPVMNLQINANMPEYTVAAYCAKYLKEIEEMNRYMDELEAAIAELERYKTMRKGGYRRRHFL